MNHTSNGRNLNEPEKPAAIGFEQIEYASVTDVGLRRGHNQDSHAVLLATDTDQWDQQGHFFLVADGMGAHAVGELASEMAANIITHTYHKHAGEGPANALRKAFVEANTSINTRGQQNREFQGMGTTATALLLRPEGAWLSHVGDSRAYRVRGAAIEQLTFDHSLVWEMARRQKVDPNGLQGVPSNVIIRSLGPDPLVQVDIEGPHPLKVGDSFVLCSDGLSGQLTDREIGAIVGVLPPAESCRFLVNLANLRGGPDNITALVVHIGGTAAEPEAPATPEVPARAPWYRRIPWPITLLGLGVLVAGEAAVLALWTDAFNRIIAFALAAVILLAGLGGLAITYFQERRRAAAEAGNRLLKVYRKAPSFIDRALLEKMVKVEDELRKLAQQKNWDADWQAYKEHHARGKDLLDKDDLAGAFREFCRAARPFTEMIPLYRNAEEPIPVAWERS